MTITTLNTYVNRYSFRNRFWKRVFQGTTSIIESNSTMKFVGQESKLRQNDTDFKVKIAKSEDATNPYTRKVWSYIRPHVLRAAGSTKNATGNIAYNYVTHDEFSFHGLAGSGNTNTGLSDRALARLKSKLYSEYLHNARLAVPTAELRELRKSIKDATSHTEKALVAILVAPAMRGSSWYRRYRRMSVDLRKQVENRRTRERLERQSEYIQSAWLQWSFGIAPMIADTLGALEAIDKFFDIPKRTARIRSSATSEWMSGQNSYSGNQDGWATDINAYASYKLQYAYVAAIDLRVVAGNNYGLAKHLGYTEFASQVPALVWELTAFSWIFDYFTTVGAYFNDTFVLPPGSTIYVTRTRKYTCKIDEFIALRKSQNPAGWFNHQLMLHFSTPGHAEYVEFQREKLTSLPTRMIRFKSLDEIGANATNKLLNLGALLKLRRD